MKYYTSWVEDAANATTLANLKKKGTINIYLNTSKMTVRPYAKATATTAEVLEDATMDFTVVEGFKIVNVVLDGEFKVTAGTPLKLNSVSEDEDGNPVEADGMVYRFTMPSNVKPYDLDVNITNSNAMAVLQAAKGEVTNIGLLATWANENQAVQDPTHNTSDDHDITRKAMTLGAGLAIDAFAPQQGHVTVDGAEIGAYGIHPDKKYESTFNSDNSKNGFNLCGNGFKTYNPNGKNEIYVKTVKVYPSYANPANSLSAIKFATNNTPFIDKLFIYSGASVTLTNANVGEIEGEDKAKSFVYFNSLSADKQIANVKSVSKVTIANSTLVLNSDPGLPAEIIDECIIAATKVTVWPETGLSNTTFNAVVWNPVTKKNDLLHTDIEIIPPVQSDKAPDYTYTFTNCAFHSETTLGVSDNSGKFTGVTPVLDEDGNYKFKTKYHYAYIDENGEWDWAETYDYDDIPQYSRDLNLVEEHRDYFYTNNNKVDEDLINNYDVIIALNKCTVNGKPADDESDIYAIYPGIYDINNKYAIDGKLYKPTKVWYWEKDKAGNTIGGTYHVWLKEDKGTK